MDKGLIELVMNANSLGVLTGAGISAASGIPTFRGKDGLWKKHRPEELANYQAFQKDPRLVWEWYLWRRELIKNVNPNAAHYALVTIEKVVENYNLITQNVDNLHTLAGNQKVTELHGNIMRSKCSVCSKPFLGKINLNAGVPKCEQCNGLIRPDVVWFGEILPQNAIQKAYEIAMRSEIFMVVGTSGVVEPAASLPFIAANNNAYVVEINPQKTPITDITDLYISDPADKALQEIEKKIIERLN